MLDPTCFHNAEFLTFSDKKTTDINCQNCISENFPPADASIDTNVEQV